ncbi:hypothetical protein DFJ73DRAFT_775109 [Zopfochytrium polystomum]|nr:hypothetical protein DFJ73DRAFT_775109 [Zopfochytrium polystomum]
MITEDKMYPNVVSYTLIIHGYVKRGEIEKALRCFADMKENGITPNRVTYETLIYGHLQCLKWNRDRRVISLGLNFGYEGADDFSDSMELSFSDAMESEEDLFLRMYEESKYQKDQWPLLDIPHQESADELSKRLDISMDFEDGSMRKEEMLQRNVECAANLFEEMLRCGHTPGVVLYDILMNAHIDRGEHQKSIDLFRRMIGAEPNVFNAKVVPDLRIYTTLLVALTASGDVEAAQYVVRLLQSRNLANPDVVMYTVLMNGYGKRGDVGEMKAVFAELLEKGLKPTVITYSTILYAHCRVGNMRAAEEVLSEIKAQGLKLNLIVYNTLIHGYGKAQDLAAATRTFNRMRKNRIKPTITTFNILMAAHIRCGDVRGTMRWFELLTSPAVAGGSRTAERTTMTAATAASQSRRPKPRMPAIRPNLITYNLLVWANAKNRNALRAAETIATMVARRFKPDVATYAPIVRMHARQGDYAAALEVARAVGGAARAEALAEAADVGGDGAAGCGAAAALASASVSVSAAGVSLRDVAAGRVPVGPLHLRGTKAGGVVSYDPMVPYNIMMSAMLRNRDYETAEGVFEWADATTRERRDANKAAEEEGAGEGSEQDGGVGGLRLSPQPDLHSFDMIVRMHGAMGQSAKSRHWVEEAIRRGVKPDVRIFNSLMTACLACKDYDGAEDAYWMMKREGLKPDMVSMALYFRVERERERLREEEEGGEAEEEEEGEVQPV